MFNTCKLFHTVQPLFLIEAAKRRIFYHITLILQYCLDETIARSGDMYKDDLCISSFVIKCFGITNTSVQNFAARISSVKTVSKCLRKLTFLWTKSIYIYHLYWCLLSVSTVICQKYFRITVIFSQILLFAPSLIMRRCTLCLCYSLTLRLDLSGSSRGSQSSYACYQ